MGEIAAVGGALLGGGLGAAQGARGTPDQVTRTSGDTSQSSQTILNPLTQEQSQLQQNSLQNYLQQMALANQYEQGMGGAQNIQDAAQQSQLGVLNGSAFQTSPQQQALIDQQRNLQVQQGSADINKLLDQRLAALSADAGQRGLRGQAYSQLQGDTVRTAAEQYGNTVRGAGQQATQASLQMPYQTVAAQSPFIQQGSNFANQMNLQAQQNRQAAQNPYLLQLLQNERLNTGRQDTHALSSGENRNVGQPGDWMQALQGFIQGAGGGARLGSSIGGGGGAAPAGSSYAPGGGFNLGNYSSQLT